jgi:hypothetical protein
MEEVKPGQTYPNEDVSVEQVDQDHLNIYNPLGGRVSESKRVGQNVRDFREQNPILRASPRLFDYIDDLFWTKRRKSSLSY